MVLEVDYIRQQNNLILKKLFNMLLEIEKIAKSF